MWWCARPWRRRFPPTDGDERGPALRHCRTDAIVWPSGKVSVGGAVVDEGAGALARRAPLGGAAGAAFRRGGGPGQGRGGPPLGRGGPAPGPSHKSLELSQALADLRGPCRGGPQQPPSAAAEKLASCRRELESVERQRAEAEAAVASARPNVESFEARRSKELDAAAGCGQEEARTSLKRGAGASAPRGPSRLRQPRPRRSWPQATLSERTTYAERVPRCPRPRLGDPCRCETSRGTAWPAAARRRSPPPASSRCSPSSTS